MVDPEVLAKFGLTAEELRKKFAGRREDLSPKLKALVDRMINRCRGGRDVNLEKSNVYYALDTAWDAAFNQITPTLLQTVLDKSADTEEVLEILRSAGMDPTKVVSEVPDPKTPGKSYKRVEAPAFFNITVPLCMAYVKIRQAKLVNDRKQVPFMKYEPVISDQLNRLRCQVITEAIEEQGRQYSHFDIFKQAVFQILHYAECLQFPVEEWHTEHQWVEEKSPFQKAEDEEENTKSLDGGFKVKKVIVKEGIRYHLPHPSRTYIDRAFPAHTINTNTGCTYAGYWRVVRWENVMNREGYFNLDRIGFEQFYGWFSGKKNHSYWTNVLKGCSVNFPGFDTADKSTPKDDSEKNVARWYSQDQADKPIVLAEHYELLIPKDYGLGEYDCPVWFRFVLAADDAVIYAAPVHYDPAVLWWGYDFVHGRTHNASMTLEVLPFQDQFSNLLAQHLITVRQNLANLTLLDQEILPEEQVKELENMGERMWRKLNFLRVRFTDKLRAKLGGPNAGGNPLKDAAIPLNFPYKNPSEILNTMRVILDTLERVLVMSSQEVGQSATHEQTREEVRQISTNTSTRVQFTNTGIDSTFDAWKRQLYNAKMAHGRMSYYAQVPLEEPISKEELQKLGFTAKSAYDERTKKQHIEANSSALLYESFASDRDGQNRVNELESARLMIDMLDKVMNNPITGPAIGADQALSMVNQIGRFLGFPRDFKFQNTGQTQTMQDQVGQALEQLKQYFDQAMQGLQQDTKGALQNVLKVNEEQDGQLAQLGQKLAQLLQSVQASAPPSPMISDQLPSPV